MSETKEGQEARENDMYGFVAETRSKKVRMRERERDKRKMKTVMVNTKNPKIRNK